MKLFLDSSSLSAKISWLPENVGELLSILFYALAASLAAVAFMFLTTELFSQAFGVLATGPRPVFIFGSLIVIVTTSAIVGFSLNVYAAEVSGSGISQLKASYWRELGYLPVGSVLIKFIAGVISIEGGTSWAEKGLQGISGLE